MTRRVLAAWLWLLLPVLPAGAAVRDAPVVSVEAGAAPASAGAAIAASPLSSALASPALAPALASPAPLPASALPAVAAAADRPEAIAYSAVLPPAAELRSLPSGASDRLGPLRAALEKRGDGVAARLAEKLYYTDPLTGLPNRAYFVERSASVLAKAQDPVVALLDMNNFGAVNFGLADLHGVTRGRERADGVLAIAGAALGELAKARGVTVTRLGGEEFAVLGERDAVLAFSADARRALAPDKVLEAAGIRADGAERRAVATALERVGSGGQPVGDFTYGVASARGVAPAEALKAADEALNSAKDEGRRGSVRIAEAGGFREWTPPPAESAPAALPAPAPRSTAEDLARLEERLTDRERGVFRELSFRDPLTLARTYDYVALKAPEWDREYAQGGMAVLSSARNLKQINDLLGHDAGDLYLHRLGVIIRQEVGKARNKQKLDVQEAIRVASKEFLLVGRDADKVAEAARREVARQFAAGRVLPAAQLERLRAEAARRGLVPESRIAHIGTLRVVSEPLAGADGRAHVKDALDRAFERLEAAKKSEDPGPAGTPAP